MNFDMKLNIEDEIIDDMITQCKLTSDPLEPLIMEGSTLQQINAQMEAADSESNYIPETDSEDV